ncbi:RCC1 domain-containing protein [Candidatus Hepatoplasma crinochetorum]|uniref:RCC1 domain-containing protein n=1 Tax=Candidatus Hepatoplasma crinochetorum TaxID=295596 RepID=UPI0030908816|nr:MAG: hypothetical protein HCTKY_5560 [Candidatus Hepatoplasma crinochetorum]
MKKYYVGILIPLLGVVPINKNLINKNEEKAFENQQIIDISAGGHHSGTIIDTDNNGYADTLYMWGNNYVGQIGNGRSGGIVESPEKIDFDWNGNLINLELGVIHSGLTVDSDYDGYADTLYMWGYNFDGEIGNGTWGDQNISKIPEKITPQGQDDWGGNIIDLSLSALNSGVTIDTDYDGYADTLYMWGKDNVGQIGNGSSDNLMKIYPTLVFPEIDDWNGNLIDLNLDGYHSGLTVDSDYDGYADTLYMWGDNGDGQIGNNTFDIIYSPEIINPVDSNWNGNIIDFDLGENSTGVTIDTDYNGYADTLYIWGNNFYGQTGNGISGYDYDNFPTPTKTEYDFKGNLIDLSLGGSHVSITIDSNYDGYADTLYVWGYNNEGQIGNNKEGVSELEDTPIIITPVDQINWSGNIVELSLGFNTTMISVDQNNDQIADSIWMWGQNTFSEAGQDGSISKVLTPQKLI